MTVEYKLNAERTAAITSDVNWIPIKDVTPPLGVSLWLINKASGVSVKSQYMPYDRYFDHWFPNPTFKKD